MQQTRQQDPGLNYSSRIRVHLLSRPSESHYVVQFYERDEFLGEVLQLLSAFAIERRILIIDDDQ